MNIDRKQKIDLYISLIIFSLSLIVLSFLRQGHITGNGAAFLCWIRDLLIFYPHHSIYLMFLFYFNQIGEFFNISRFSSGIFLSAVLGSLSLSLFYLLLREYISSVFLCIYSVILLFWSYPFLFSATSVESHSSYLFSCTIVLLSIANLYKNNNLKNWILLTLSFIILIGFHIAGCFFIFAICLSGIIYAFFSESKNKTDGLKWLLCGIIAAAFMIIIIYQDKIYGSFGKQIKWFDSYYTHEVSFSGIFLTFKRNVNEFFRHALFTIWLFPAGFFLLNKNEKYLIPITLITNIIYLLFFGRWSYDDGCFYLPLYIVNGLLSTKFIERGLLKTVYCEYKEKIILLFILVLFAILYFMFFEMLLKIFLGVEYIFLFIFIFSIILGILLRKIKITFLQNLPTYKMTLVSKENIMLAVFFIIMLYGNWYSSYYRIVEKKSSDKTKEFIFEANKFLPKGGYIFADIKGEFVNAYLDNAIGLYARYVISPRGENIKGEKYYAATVAFQKFLTRDCDIIFDEYAYNNRALILERIDIDERILNDIKYEKIASEKFKMWRLKI